MDTMDLYQQAQDRFDAVVNAVGADQWDAPSACTEWSVRDVTGHVIWAQHQLRAWALGEDYQERGGAPGSATPRVLAGADPVATWRAARQAATPTLSEATLTTPASIPGMGEIPLIAIVELLTTDLTAHAWDVGHALGRDVRLDPALVSFAFDWGRAHATRGPAFFGPELTPPEGADEQTRMLAFLGRA